MMKRPAPSDIDIIVTGGHFERRRNAAGAEFYETNGKSQTEALIMEALGPTPAVRTVFLKDSSSLTQEDRQTICEAAELTPSSRIVIVHGTSTLDETARFLFGMQLQKTIILTGTTAEFSKRPAEAFFNLGSAISLAQALPFGVYGAMNGRIIPPMSLRKDADTGRFDTASGEHLTYTADRR